MTYRDPSPPAPEARPRAAGTPEDPHPYGYGDGRCPKCGARLVSPRKTQHVGALDVLRVEHSQYPMASCVWYTRTYEHREPDPPPGLWLPWHAWAAIAAIVLGNAALWAALVGE